MGKEDSVVWKLSGSTQYPTKSIGVKMLEDKAPNLSKHITHLIWQRFIPPRAQLSVSMASGLKLEIFCWKRELLILN